MRYVFTENGWKDYTWWQTHDRKGLKRVNQLLEDCARNGYRGIGKPEALVGDLAGFWSRRINDRDRLVYRVSGEDIEVLSCRFHYSDG